MSGNLGLWIDHGKAFMVEHNGQGEKRRKILSEVEANTRYHAVERSIGGYGGLEGTAEKKAGNRRANQLKAWYKTVIEAVGANNPERILILGPGEAKVEFLHEIEKDRKLSGKVVGMETTARLTENQIAATIREYFDREGGSKIPPYRRPPGA